MSETKSYLKIRGIRPPFDIIITQINSAYQSEMFSCVDLLTRKLLETLIIDVLLKNPGPVAVWIDPKKNIKQTFHYMLTRFWDFINSAYKEFIPQYSKESLHEYKNTSWELKKIGDIQAHTIVQLGTKEEIDERRKLLQNFIDFILDIREKIPESITLATVEEKSSKDGLEIMISHPKSFPSNTEMGTATLAPFDIIISIKGAKEQTNCKVAVASESQAAIFEWEPPVKRWNWRTFPPRKEEIDLAIDCLIETHLSTVQATEFRFHCLFRKNWLRRLQKEIVFHYRVVAFSKKSKMMYDSEKCRFVIPIGDDTD